MVDEKIISSSSDVNAEELMKKFDRDSKSRNFTGVYKIIYNVLFILFAVYILSTALIFKRLTTYTKLPLFLGLALFIGYLKFPACKKDGAKENYIPWYDIVLAILSLGSCLYYVFAQNEIIYSGGIITTVDIVVGIIGIITILELCRRAVGLPLLIVVGAFMIYGAIWLISNNSSTALRNFVYSLFYNVENGILSTPVSVCCSFIVIFIIFGAFLEKTGIGSFFVDLANSLVGASAGGPAKVAVISSALEGMYSGSSVANTVGSGSITIPIMKKIGYKPEFAAAVEAAASTGGQIMPPIMGAAAFLMSQITGVPYATIVICAILPAILYFAGIFITVHLEAKKLGLKGLPKEAIPNFFKLILKKGYLLIPIIVLVVCMNSYTPAMSACFAILLALSVSMIDPNTFENLISKDKKRVLTALKGILLCLIPLVAYLLFSNVLTSQATSRALAIAIAVAVICSIFNKNPDAPLTFKVVGEGLFSGTNNSVGVIIACAMAGIISGVVQMTGLGSTLITLIVPIAQKSLIIALFLTMICCIVLGMGVPTTANYVIMATIMAPILIRANVEMLAAHMFVFYFGIVADITPPVALAAYAGSAIAKSNPLKTGVTATKLAIGAFIIPYIFVYNPSLLLIGNPAWYQVIFMFITSIIGMFGIASALEGHIFGKLQIPLRIICACAGLLLIIPETITDIIGFVLIVGVVVLNYLLTKKHKLKNAN